MKSGIYKNPNGDLIYVAKDRSVRARLRADGVLVPISEASRKEFRVTSRNKDQFVEFEDGTLCERFADVPNGCTDPARAIVDALKAHYEASNKPFDGVVSEIKFTQVGDTLQPYQVEFARALGAIDAPDDTEVRSRLKSEGFRFCHSQSARKHRRRGREVRYVPEVGAYAWRAAA